MRAGLACYPVVLVGGWIATQYWHDRWFSLVVPGLVGLSCAAAAVVAAKRLVPALPVAAVAGLLAVAFSYSLVPGGAGLVNPPAQALPPYLAVLVGVAVWRLLFGGASRDTRAPGADRAGGRRRSRRRGQRGNAPR